MSRLTRGLAGLCALALAGCASSPPPEEKEEERPAYSGILTPTHDAVDALLATAEERMQARGPILVTRIADLRDIELRSTFGQLLGEAAATRLAARGLQVHEARLREDALIERENGAFVLSRVHGQSPEIDAHAILAGTYAMAGGIVYVTLKLLAATDGSVLGAADYTMPLSGDLRPLLPAPGTRLFALGDWCTGHAGPCGPGQGAGR